jgi:hypothetical protein
VTRLEQLRHAVSVLAASPENQILSLIEIGLVNGSRPIDELTNVDELALQFEDATYLLGGLVHEGHLSPIAAEAIGGLSEFLLNLSGRKNSDFWTIKALRADPRWVQVRQLARECLSVMQAA